MLTAFQWFCTCIRHNANKVETNLVFSPNCSEQKLLEFNEISILWGTEREREIHYWLSSKAHLLPPITSKSACLVVRPFQWLWCFLLTKQIKAGPSLRNVISSRLPQSGRFGRANEKERDGKRNRQKKGWASIVQVLFSSSSHPKREKSWEHAPLEPFLQDAFNRICFPHPLVSKGRVFFYLDIYSSPHQSETK